MAGSSKVEEMTSPLHRALHVGDFLGPLVDQQHDEVALGVIGRDRLCDILQQYGLTGTRRRNDHGALAFAERRHEIHDAGATCP